MNPPIYWVTGPPAAGKTTLCQALVATFERGIHVPVDDLRLWVTTGLADSIPWTEETERQFQVAEDAVCDVAGRYARAGFAVAVDHCRNLARLDNLIQARLPDFPVVRVCLLPELAENLQRNHARTNKTFDPRVLDETIRFTHDTFRSADPDGWLVIDNSRLSVEETVRRVLEFSS